MSFVVNIKKEAGEQQQFTIGEGDHFSVEKNDDGVCLVKPGAMPDHLMTKSTMEAIVKKRFAKHVLRDKAHEDEPIFRAAAAHRGIDLDEHGNLVGVTQNADMDAVREKARQSVISAQVDPLKVKIKDRDARIVSLERSAISGELAQAAASAGMRPAHVGRDSPFLKMHASRFGIEPESQRVAEQRDGEFVIAAEPEKGDKGFAYVTPTQYITKLKGDKDYADFFDKTTVIGTGANRGSNRNISAEPIEGQRRSKMTVEEKVEIMKEQGREKLEAIPI